MNLELTEALYTKLATLAPVADADSFVYRCGFAADAQLKKEYKENNPEATKEELAAYLLTQDYKHIALYNVKQQMKVIAGMFDENRLRTLLTGKGNYRENVASIQQYKGNRDSTHKPRYYQEIRDYLCEVWDAEIVEGMEADDKAGIIQWSHKDKSTIICSIDKDLFCIPGWHYNPNKGTVSYVTKTEADLHFWKQVGTGDATDHIPGLKGVGPKTVEKWAAQADNNPHLLEERVRQEYAARFGDRAQAVLHENASLLWIQRVEGINYDGSKLSDYQYAEYEYGNEESNNGNEATEDCVEGQHPVGSEQARLADVEG
jgi:hypothetical protein